MNKIINNKIFKIIYTIIKVIIFTLLILYLGFNIIQRVIKTDIFGYRIFTVSSNSMKPIYEKGDIILVKNTNVNDLKINDIITYAGNTGELKGLTITHRIVKITEDEKNSQRIITKGDANNAEDPSIAPEQILGVATYRLKIFSILSKMINNKFFFFFLVFIPLALVFCIEVLEFFGLIRKGVSDEDE